MSAAAPAADRPFPAPVRTHEVPPFSSEQRGAPGPESLVAVVVDRVPLMRLGLDQALTLATVRVAGHGEDLHEGFTVARRERANLLVVGDGALPDAVVAERAQSDPGGRLQVVVLVTEADPLMMVGLLRAGVAGIALRSVSEAGLADVVSRVARGQRAVGPALISALVGHGPDSGAAAERRRDDPNPAPFAAGRPDVMIPAGNGEAGTRPPSTAPPTAVLTNREHQVLFYLAQGASNQVIARALYVAPSTVKTHLLHIYSKLGVGSRWEALSRAVALGLVY